MARGVPRIVWLAVLCGAVRYAGAVWDVSWHRTIGRDSVWSPPHVLLYVAVLGSTYASAWLRRHTDDPKLKRAATLALTGNAFVLAAAPFDALWHGIYGPDVDIWSPPHLLAVFGTGLSGLGWLMIASWWPQRTRTLRVVTQLFFGWTVYAGWFALNWFQMDATRRDDVLYPSLVGLVVLPLLLLGRHITGNRRGATAGAAAFMLVASLPVFVLGALGWVPPALPPLLIVPALAIDLLLGQPRPRFTRIVGAALVSGAAMLLFASHSLDSALDALDIVIEAHLAGALLAWLIIRAPRPHLPRLLAQAGPDGVLGPAERLRFERMRLGVRAGLLFGPTLLIGLFGEHALGPALLAVTCTVGSGVVIAALLWRRPALLLRYQLVARLVDVALIWLSISWVQEFTGRALYDQIYLLPIISASATHGKRGAYVVSAAAAVAVVAERMRMVRAGSQQLDALMIGDAVMHILLFFIIGLMLDMLMRTSAGVVEQLWRSEQQAAQAALRESESRYRLVSELTSDFAFGFRVEADGALCCEWVTEAMARMTGYTLPELMEQGGWARLLHPDDVESVRAWWALLLAGESRASDFRIITRGGDVRLLRGHARPVRNPGSGAVERVYGAAQDITERNRWEQALEHQALHDALTDLPNRALLQDRLATAIAGAARDGSHLALMMMDLNRFKDVNDTFGHHHGDLLLQQVGQRLRASLRASDTVARLGGDEFAILLPATDGEAATLLSAKLLRSLEAPFEVEGHLLEIGASIGMALYPEHASDADALLRRADTAMYAAKRTGGGRSVYEHEMDRDSFNRPELIGELRHALEHDELVLHFQPRVEVASGRVVGVEALVRWQHPRAGLLGPDRFIGLAEETGLIRPLTRWVLCNALVHAATWHERGLALPVAVNLSARNLHDRDLPEMVAAVLAERHAEPSWLELEVTESCLLQDTRRARELLGRLQQLGVRVAIDDFGTGYSSLAYLKQLPVQQLKIDRSFVQQLGHDENDAAIVRATIELGHSLGLAVVAEGVEDAAGWDYLARLGCDEAQGYLIARPVPAPELLAWLLAGQDRSAA